MFGHLKVADRHRFRHRRLAARSITRGYDIEDVRHVTSLAEPI